MQTMGCANNNGVTEAVGNLKCDWGDEAVR